MSLKKQSKESNHVLKSITEGDAEIKYEKSKIQINTQTTQDKKDAK